MKSWKIALAIGISVLVLCGCGGNSGENSSSSQSDPEKSAQIIPGGYDDIVNDQFCYVDNVLAKRPKSYPFPSDYFKGFSKGCVTADGEWVYVFGYDPEQDIEFRNDEYEKYCLYRFPTKGLTKDPKKNLRKLQKIDIDYAVTSESPILSMPDGSMLLIVDESTDEDHNAIFHLTDSESKLIEQDHSKYEILEDGTVFYSGLPNRFGCIFYDDAESKLKSFEITLEEGIDIIKQDKASVYYYTHDNNNLTVYRADYNGTVTKLGNLDINERTSPYETRFQFNNDELEIAICNYKDPDDTWSPNTSYQIYRITADGTIMQVAEDVLSPHFGTGFCLYNKSDINDETIYYVSNDKKETVQGGIRGRLSNMYEAEDGSSVMLRIDKSVYYAKRENDTLVGIKLIDGSVNDVFYVENVPYFKQNENLYCIKDGEICLVIEGFDKQTSTRLTEEGYIIRCDTSQNHRFTFYKDGEQIGETIELQSIGYLEYIADTTFFYSDTIQEKNGFKYTTHILNLSPEGAETINEFSGSGFNSFKKYSPIYLNEYLWF